MKKMLLVVGLGTMFALGACADNNKKVTTTPVKPDSGTAAGSPAPMGASRAAVSPDYGTGTGTGTGTSPDSSMVGMGTTDGTGTYIPHTGTTPKKPTVTKSTPSGTHVTSASGGSKTTVASATSAHGKKYTVKKGDTLSAIAKKYYGKTSAMKKIVAANPGLNPDKIRVGQTINLPA